MSEQELLSLREAAAQYSVPVETLRTAVQRKYMAARKIGNTYVVKQRDIETYVKNRPKRGRPKKNA